ncbi:Pre-mRNA-splicing factor ECM2 PWA37_002568 [Arxiozyma heterogenica]|uniref:Pre-mRNA-splicing factor SLT11 n=1 Tax=Arxiozyma heterogenica TaxID=278026 RepID=A0AAN7W3L3_9SACH|nr:hypothetical protein RI543_002215 [Kazachstania heterogenica]
MSASPIICDECLGPEEDIRMIKVPDGAECRLCNLAFDLFHFKRDKRSNTIIKTIICSTCAKQRNVCQCCMLDMLWHISIEERDQLLSLIKGYNITTKEATNEMMKRFLALKKGNKKIGSAAMMTNDKTQLDILMQEMKESLQREMSKLTTNKSKASLQQLSKIDLNKFANVNIQHLLERLPLNESLEESKIQTTRFFIYNIYPSLAEWKIADRISQLLNNSKWKDDHPLSMIINHKATCGSINFKSLELAQKFVNVLVSNGDIISGTDKSGNIVQRGILKVDYFNLYVVPWVKDNFTQNTFGNNTKEYIKLSIILRNTVTSDLKLLEQSHRKRKNNSNELTDDIEGKKNKKKKKRKETRRVTTSFAL